MKKRGKKIKPRNFLVPVLRFKRSEVFLDKKKERSKKRCREKVIFVEGKNF